jgi:hypothetical protein
MVTERNAKARRGQQCGRKGEMKPIKPEIPEVQRNGRERQKKRPDQERTGRPVNAVDRNAENQRARILRWITGSFTWPVQE